MENKRKLKRKFWNRYPHEDKAVQLGMINIKLLENSLFYVQNLLNDINESCEGDEFIKKNFYIPRYEFSQKTI